MGSSKRARRRARTHRNRRRPTDAGAPLPRPRPLRLISDSFTELDDYLQSADSPVAAAELARERMRQHIDQIVTLTAGHDPLDVAECIAVTNLTVDPETYTETEHEGVPVAVELTALIAGSATAAAVAAPPGQYDITAQPAVDEIQAAALATSTAAGWYRLFTALQDEHSAAGFSFLLATREAGVRNAAYPHMLRDTLDQLLSAPAVDSQLYALVGFTAADLLRVADRLAQQRTIGWRARFDRLREFEDIARDWDPESAPADAAARARAAFTDCWASPSAVAVLQPAALADELEMNPDTVERILEFFTCDLSAETADQLADRFFRGDNPLRARPIMRSIDGRRYLVNDLLVLPAVLDRVEILIKDRGDLNQYTTHRGDTIEDAAIALLRAIVPTAAVHTRLKYFVPDPDQPDQTRPEQYTKLVETDGLLIVDDVALVLEVKAGALSPAARAGNATRLRRDLKSLLTEGAAQAARTRDRINTDHALRLADGSILDLADIRETHTIVVTLEDLSGLATITDELVTGNLLPRDLLPLTISLHDLRIISEVIDRPAELLLYLRRRTLPEQTRQYLAPDELDYFLHFLRLGLYVEPDPDQLVTDRPDSPPTTAERRRFAAQRQEWLTSQTDPLDQWYAHRLGHRQTPAAKPTFNGNPAVLQLVDQITDQARPGWLSTTTMLLSGSHEVQAGWAQVPHQLAAATRRDHRDHTLTAVIGDRRHSGALLVWLTEASVTDPARRATGEQSYRRYLAVKKDQLQLPRGAALVFDNRGTYRTLLFDHSPPMPAEDLAAAILELGLRSPEQMNPAVGMMTLRQRARGPRRRR